MLDVTGEGCLLVASVTLMTLLYLLLQHIHLEECCKSAQIFAMERNLMFNAGKTQLICFRRHKSVVVNDCIEFCGQKLNFSDSVSHLGHLLSCDLSDSAELKQKLKNLSGVPTAFI